MLKNQYLKDWSKIVSYHFPHLSLPEVVGLATLARWDEGYQEPWLIVTDLKPKEGNALWYSLWSWIEASYRDIKSDGWQAIFNTS